MTEAHLNTTSLLAEIEALRATVALLSVHQGYGVLTCEAGRLALQQAQGREVDLLYCDLDGLHGHNERLGYAEVDRRVKAAFRRRASDTVAALKASGDEFFFIVKAGEGAGLAVRLQAELEARGLSATWAVVERTRDAQGALTVAVERVRMAKAARGITR